MPKRIALYGLIAFTIVMIFLFSASTNYYKRPFSPNEDVQFFMTNLSNMVEKQDWVKAELELTYLETAWGKVRKRIQFTGEEDDIKKINEALFQLKSSLQLKDMIRIKEELATIQFGWNDIGK